MRPLGESLAGRGFPVRGVRLAGHATDVTDLARTGWRDWFASVATAADRFRAEQPRMAVVGMSLGALLALRLAITRPADVSALVLCGTPIGLGGLVRWLPLVSRVPWFARRYAIIPKRGDGPDIADPVVRQASNSYRSMPLAAIVELLELQRVIRADLARVTQPVLLLHGRHDHSVPLANLDYLRRRIRSTWIETGVLERSWHVITLDYDRDEVARLAGDFLTGVEAARA
jgi:carboxylesterase